MTKCIDGLACFTASLAEGVPECRLNRLHRGDVCNLRVAKASPDAWHRLLQLAPLNRNSAEAVRRASNEVPEFGLNT